MQNLKLFEGGHFTVSKQGQLKNRLSRWSALTRQPIPELDETRLRKGRDVLCWLDQQLSQIEFSL